MVDASNPLVQEVVQGRHVACLATENADETIHMVAVWYLFDGEHFYVATSSRSAKARNLRARPRASLMVDVRHPVQARGMSASGRAQILTGQAAREWNQRIHERYLSKAALADERVGPVFTQWDDITIQLKPERYMAWDMREADKAVFGGSFSRRPDYLLPLEP